MRTSDGEQAQPPISSPPSPVTPAPTVSPRAHPLRLARPLPATYRVPETRSTTARSGDTLQGHLRTTLTLRLNATSALTILSLALLPQGLLAVQGNEDRGTPLPRVSGPLPGYPSFQDVMELESVGPPRIDPRGERIVFLRGAGGIDERTITLWMWSPSEGTREFGSGPDFTGQFEWTADGRYGVLLHTGGAGSALRFFKPEAPRSPERVVALPFPSIQEYALSPDGRWVALLVPQPPSAAATFEQELLGPFMEEDEKGATVDLWLLDLNDPSAPPRRMTDGVVSVQEAVWSPTRPELAIVHGPPEGRNNFWLNDISLVDVETASVTPWVTEPGKNHSVVWSPDGDRIALVTTPGEALTNAAAEIGIADRPGGSGDGEQAVRVVTAAIPTEATPVAWGAHGLVFVAELGTHGAMFLLPKEGGAPRRLPTPGLVIQASEFDQSMGGSALAFMAAPTDGMWDIHLMDLESASISRVTDVGQQVADWQLGSRETIRWSASDGTEIEGVLHRPPDFDPRVRRPLLVDVHGGPRAAALETIADHLPGYGRPVLHWLWKGALVLEPNYRGSSGYGTDFRRLHPAGIGEGDAGDVLAGIQHLVDAGLVDENRVGVMGWSYGGFISAWISATNREDSPTKVAAVSAGAGITDWRTHYGWEYDNYTTGEFSFGGPPWQRGDAYDRASPMTYVEGARTPTLFQHVEDDPIVPLAGSRRQYRALLEQGVDTRMIVYPGRSHGVPLVRQRLGAMWQNWAWFAKYLWGEEASPSLDAEVR